MRQRAIKNINALVNAIKNLIACELLVILCGGLNLHYLLSRNHFLGQHLKVLH